MSTEFKLVYINVNVWKDKQPAWANILKWCELHDRTEVNLLNSIIPAINFCLENYTTVDKEGNLAVELNLGKVIIEKRRKGYRWTKKAKTNLDQSNPNLSPTPLTSPPFQES